MTDRLPKMPKPARTVGADSLRLDHVDRLFTADQLRAYGAACYAAGIEAAAVVCDGLSTDLWDKYKSVGTPSSGNQYTAGSSAVCSGCADAIRAAAMA